MVLMTLAMVLLLLQGADTAQAASSNAFSVGRLYHEQLLQMLLVALLVIMVLLQGADTA